MAYSGTIYGGSGFETYMEGGASGATNTVDPMSRISDAATGISTRGTTWGDRVMTWAMGVPSGSRPSATTRRNRSRSVKMPSNRPSPSTTGTAATSCATQVKDLSGTHAAALQTQADRYERQMSEMQNRTFTIVATLTASGRGLWSSFLTQGASVWSVTSW